ncbi:MAG TPA: DUF983 domain-containing protein [Ferruginibacter sp.]|nr:DUF983 domain-containing protein [Ferruginibacter sp.]HRE62787.1 DUF983 domain-containing protein [Ferruginibacter sp.]
MSEEIKKAPKPNFYWSIFAMRCPRCRKGPMFNHPNAYKKISLKHIFDMPEHCSVCNQKFDMEPGFWYGTGYVSYGLAVAVSVASFIAWWIFIGISVNDNRVLWWLVANAVLLTVLQPWLMRLSRVIYICFFVHYDPHYKQHKPREFE